jgi:hypothetical protein
MCQVQDSFLEEKYFNTIKKTLTSSNFPWYYQPSLTSFKDNQDSCYMAHIFYRDGKVNSEWISILDPLFKALNVSKLINIRANLTLKGQNAFSNFHEDDEDNKEDHPTSIFYVNTNNGYTHMKKDNQKVYCVENRLLTFNHKELHKVVGQSDENQRIILNLNYYI